MGRSRTEKKSPNRIKSHTLPSSPSHSFSSSSSSDFEFRISLSPRKSATTTNICPADELFYKGQLLPLHLSPRLSMVRTLLLSSSSTSSSSDTTTSASRDSSGSSSSSDVVLFADYNCDSSRPSSVTEDEELKRLTQNYPISQQQQIKKSKYFSLSKFSSVFKKDNNKITRTTGSTTEVSISVSTPGGSSSVKRMSEVIRKYVKKVRPLYEKLSQKQQHQKMSESVPVILATKIDRSIKEPEIYNSHNNCSGNNDGKSVISHSFSGNLRYPRRRNCVSSCPSSMRSSPSHSGVLTGGGYSTTTTTGRVNLGHSDSSMEELQSAIQGAIAHCKNSMMQNKSMISNEI